jgi:predicted transcriptional regulator
MPNCSGEKKKGKTRKVFDQTQKGIKFMEPKESE